MLDQRLSLINLARLLLGALDDLTEAGVTIRILDSSERAAWIETVQPLWLFAEGTIGVNLINSALNANETDQTSNSTFTITGIANLCEKWHAS